jgi:hypothetical protein
MWMQLSNNSLLESSGRWLAVMNVFLPATSRFKVAYQWEGSGRHYQGTWPLWVFIRLAVNWFEFFGSWFEFQHHFNHFRSFGEKMGQFNVSFKLPCHPIIFLLFVVFIATPFMLMCTLFVDYLSVYWGRQMLILSGREYLIFEGKILKVL